jgi:hypothetical protein
VGEHRTCGREPQEPSVTGNIQRDQGASEVAIDAQFMSEVRV